jgi:hypothetical protein
MTDYVTYTCCKNTYFLVLMTNEGYFIAFIYVRIHLRYISSVSEKDVTNILE